MKLTFYSIFHPRRLSVFLFAAGCVFSQRPSLPAADILSTALAAPEKIPLVKQLNSSAPSTGLTGIKAYFH
jgi:hypothetical protein